MNRKVFFIVVVMMVGLSFSVYSHCEIPCGIYGDETRITLIKEHITTVEKSMKKIVELSSEKDKNYNQIVRWVNNKEEHAKKIQHIVTQYFMTQRIKLVDGSDEAEKEKYQKELALLHEMLVYSMKTKQTTDLSYVEKMKSTIEEFEKSYLKK